MSERPKDLRPREKLQRRGASSLSDYELIMAIIGSGNAAADVTQISREVLKVIKTRGNDLQYDDLIKIKALGPAKATQLIASFELWRRRLVAPDRPVIDNINDVVAQLADIRTKKQEHFICMTLDGANRLVNRRIVTIGILNASLVHRGRSLLTLSLTVRRASLWRIIIPVALSNPAQRTFKQLND